MANVVFTQKSESIYDDLPEERYHFPRTYLNAVKQAVGHWVVYYRPRRGTSANSLKPASTYFAIARLVSVQPDSANADLFYAHVADYLEFDNPVPFKREEGSYEVTLLKDDGTVNKGAFGRSVRVLEDQAFNAIVQAGFTFKTMPWESASDEIVYYGENRPVVERISRRVFRDRHFRLQVCEAYGNRCAVTGLAILNGGGRPEVQAAHIKPVADNGPDSIRNGLALSGTAHWMFDRGLITLDSEFKLVVSPSLEGQAYGSLVEPGRQIFLPSTESDRPSSQFIEYHQNNIFHE